MSLSDAFDGLSAILSTLPNIDNVYRQPIESPSVFPFAVVQPATGTYENTAVGSILTESSHSLTAMVLVSRVNLPNAVERTEPYADLLQKALQERPTLNDTVQIVQGLSYTFGVVNWAGIDMLGYTFSIPVKMTNC